LPPVSFLAGNCYSETRAIGKYTAITDIQQENEIPGALASLWFLGLALFDFSDFCLTGKPVFEPSPNNFQ
jgi:hypothetical protein